VHLDLLKGTLTLDGSQVYFDDALSSHLESLGLWVAGQQVHAHGRRLQDGQAILTGIFSIFEDWEFAELPDTFVKPQAPVLPYKVTILERRPCKTVQACQSQYIDGEFLPGYDSETNSIMTRVEVIETENWRLSTERLPNHPTQQLLTFTDHTAQTTRLIQFTDFDFPTRCVDKNYTAPSSFLDPDEWYVTYIGDVERKEKEYEVLDESYTAKSSTNRVFHLIHRNASWDVPDQEALIHFEDDSATLLMKRVFVPDAAAKGSNLQEVIVVDMQEINSTHADLLLDDYVELLDCGKNDTSNVMKSDFPIVDGEAALEETLDQVLFYVQDMIEVGSLGIGPYWQKAMGMVNALHEAAQEQESFLEEAIYTNDTDEDGSDRRLLNGRQLVKVSTLGSKTTSSCFQTIGIKSSDPTIRFCHKMTTPTKQSDCPDCYCATFGITSGPATSANGVGWYGKGAVKMGDFCIDAGEYSLGGYIEAGYIAGYSKKYLGVSVGCSIRAYVRGEGNTANWYYACRDTQECEESAERLKPEKLKAFKSQCRDAAYEIRDSRRLQDKAATWQQGALRGQGVSVNATSTVEREVWEEELGLAEAEAGEDTAARRLIFFGTSGRRRRGLITSGPAGMFGWTAGSAYCSLDAWDQGYAASRRRMLLGRGAEVALTFGAGGGCSAAGAGFDIIGAFRLTYGPFPKPQYKPKMEGKVGLSVCVNVFMASFCLDIFQATLFSKQL